MVKSGDRQERQSLTPGSALPRAERGFHAGKLHHPGAVGGNSWRAKPGNFSRVPKRPPLSGVQHRILYFFHGNQTAVVSHGVIKESKVPMAEIERAIRRIKRFQSDPSGHTFVPVKGE
jgi:hypothetical protein